MEKRVNYINDSQIDIGSGTDNFGNTDPNRKYRMSDYLYVIIKWRRFIISFLLIGVVASGIYAFLLPQKYKAAATVMIPPDNSMGLGGLTGLLSASKSSSIGAKIFGMASTSEDLLIGILNSRTANETIIKKFGLVGYYEAPNMDKALRAFSDDVSFSMTDNGFIEISVINKNPKNSAAIANHFIVLLDSLNTKLSVEQAKNNRIFLEKRYLKNLSDLKMAEDSLYRFQKRYGVFAVPQQMEAAVKAAAEIESQLAQAELAAQMVKGQYGENSPHYSGALAQVQILKDKVNELKNASALSENSNVLFPFKQAPDMTVQYLRLFREIEIQQKIMEIMLPMYEQVKFEEQKSIPAVQIVDKAVPPVLKDSPKRAFIILGISFVVFFITILIVYRGESAVNRGEYLNPFEVWESSFFRKLKKIFRVR